PRRGPDDSQAAACTRAGHLRGGPATETRQKLPAAERRRAVVKAAARVFAEGSYRGTTTAEIARAVGCSEPILYRHFPSKRQLYFSCIEHAWAELRARFEAVLAIEDPEEALASLSHDIEDLVRGKHALSHFWAQALTESAEDPEIRRYVRRHLKDVHAFLSRLIRHG